MCSRELKEFLVSGGVNEKNVECLTREDIFYKAISLSSFPSILTIYCFWSVFAADSTFQLKMYSFLLCYFCSHGLVVLQVLREVLREKLVN